MCVLPIYANAQPNHKKIVNSPDNTTIEDAGGDKQE